MRCQHAWALQYIAGIREPDVPWSAIAAGAPHTSRQRSTALGKEIHGRFETWQRGGFPNWKDLPGQIALSGAHFVPHPSLVVSANVEQPIGRVPLPPDPTARPDAPKVGLHLHGVMWAGFKDLVVSAPEEFDRLGLHCPDEVLLVDYKSSANIARYALTPAELRTDVQASLYVIDVCERYDIVQVPARWLYLETKSVRRAEPRDARLSLERAYEILDPPARLARQLDLLERVSDAPKNPARCGDYGGCPHHMSRGGTCDARQSLSALVPARIRKAEPMALSPELKKKFDEIAKKKAAAEAEADEPESDTTEEETTDETETDAEEEKPVAKAPSLKPKAPAAKPGKKPSAKSPTPATGKVGQILAKQSELADAQAAVDHILGEIGELLAT